MAQIKDLSGQVINSWTVIRLLPKTNRRRYFLCRCVCGVEKPVDSGHLTWGRSKCCGCAAVEATRARFTTHGHEKNKTKSKTLNSWRGMMDRCYNENHICYHKYGGAGIYVVDPWHKFEVFLDEMGERPPGTSIDRIDNSGPYSKENCRWATPTQQANNKSNNRMVTYKGVTKTASEWASEIGVKTGHIIMRLLRGWSDERAIGEPFLPAERIIEFGGKSLSVSAWARHLGVNKSSLSQRINKGWPIHLALTTPFKRGQERPF